MTQKTFDREHSRLYFTHEELIFKDVQKPYRLTPIICTFYEGLLTDVDIQKMIEMDIHIVRFKMTHVTRTDKLRLLSLLHRALIWVCEKYDVSQWPVAVSMDIPNACIRSGYIHEDIKEQTIRLEMDDILEMTCDVKYWNKSTPSRLFMDDPHTMETIVVGNEISLNSGPTQMECIEVIDSQTIKLKVLRGGLVGNCDFVCVRSLRLKRPPLQKKDMELIEFAKEFRFDIITLHSVRYPATLKRIKKMFREVNYYPVILSSICEQEGVERFDLILKESDGIVMARDFLAYSLSNVNDLPALQMILSAKCKQVGKPFFISGNVMEDTVVSGELSTSDLSDITNAVMQGAGFVIKNYTTPANGIKAMDMINTVCKTVESVAVKDEFYRLCDEFKVPTNAAECCLLGCALMARQTNSVVIVIPTVTGRTAIQLTHILPQAIVITISTNADVAKKLQCYRGIVSIIYDKARNNDWYEETEARIQFAVKYGVKKNILKYGNSYVTLCKSSPTSAFCDNLSVWKVVTKETGKKRMECEEDGTPSQERRLSGPSTHLLGVHHHHPHPHHEPGHEHGHKHKHHEKHEHKHRHHHHKDSYDADNKDEDKEVVEDEEGKEITNENIENHSPE